MSMDFKKILGKQKFAHAQRINNKLRETQASITNAQARLIDVAPLMAISLVVQQQKYTQYPFADLVPTKMGNELNMFGKLTFTEKAVGNDFESGIIKKATKNSNLEKVDSALSTRQTSNETWAKEIEYSIIEIQSYNKIGDYSMVEAKERARRRQWDQGIMKLAINGLSLDGGTNVMGGITNAAGVRVSTSITKSLADMTAAELTSAASTIALDYQSTNNFLGVAERFIIPYNVYTALTAPFNNTALSLETKFEIFQRSLRLALMSPNLQVVAAPVADVPAEGPTPARDRYALVPYDADSAELDINANYQVTTFGTTNNFQFQNVAYGQFYGVEAKRPTELLYFNVPKPTVTP